MTARNSFLALALLAGCALCSAPVHADEAPEGAATTEQTEKTKWEEHMGDLPFIIGYEKGMKQVELTGKPPMYFFTTTWWGYCKKLAGAAFKDEAVVKAMEHFIPILVDGDTEKSITAKYKVSGYPNTVFADTKGEAVKSVSGAVPTATFLGAVESSAKKAKRGKPSKEYGKQLKAQEQLSKALAKDNVKSALKAISEIEKTGLETPILTEAVEAKKKLMADGAAQLKEARELFEKDDLGKAASEARKLKLAYKGTDLEDEAGKLLDEIKAKQE